MATAVSINDERHASSLIVALELYPQMVIKMIHEFPPNKVLRMIQCDPNEKFMTSLNYSEKKLIQTLSTDGFNKLDMSLLYKLIRCFNLIPEPSKKWGNRPLATDINHGDDMERMRFNSNNLVHRSRGGLSEEERDKFFKESIEIACRVDNFIGESTSSFETRIRNAKIHGIKHEKYRQVLEKCVELQQQLKDISRINSVDLYYGDDIAVKLGHQDLPATDSTRCTIYIRDPNMGVPTIIKQLEQVKKELNEESYHLKLLDAKNSYPSGTPEKKKLVDYKIDPDQLKLIKEDEGNKILWNEAKEFTKEGVQGMAFVGRQKVCSVVPRNHFGPIPGIEVGTLWKFRKQVSEAGVHRQHIAGIHGREVDGAYSIVLSGEYEDDKDDGDQFTYTGSGGRDLKGSWHKKTAQSCDQTLTLMNKALARNVNVPINANNGACVEDWKEGKPVRVVRNCKGRKHSKYAPEEGNRYDGIYKIVKYWPENGKSGFLVWRYLFRRDDPNPAPWSKAGKKKIEELGLTMQYPEGYLEAQAKKDEEAGEVSKKGKRKRDDNDSSPSGTPEKKKKFVGYKIDPDQLKVIKEFTKEGAQYPEGYLEAQAKKEEEAGEVTKKEKRKRDDNDSSPSGTPEKKKLVGYKIDPDQLKLIKEDEGNTILWNEAKEFTKEGAQVDGLVIKEEEQEGAVSTALLDDNASSFKQARAKQEDERKEDSNMLYRLLRPGESWRDGLCAKNPHSTTSVFDYVNSGSWETQSKYISTCGSFEAVKSFRSKSRTPGSIVKIKKDKLPSSVDIIDLRRQEKRFQYIDYGQNTDLINRFNNFAKTFEEVLLVGHVPKSCLELM